MGLFLNDIIIAAPLKPYPASPFSTFLVCSSGQFQTARVRGGAAPAPPHGYVLQAAAPLRLLVPWGQRLQLSPSSE